MNKEQEPLTKTIKLSDENWAKLSKLRIDYKMASIDAVIDVLFQHVRTFDELKEVKE